MVYYKQLQNHHNNQVHALASLLTAISLVFPATSKQLLDQPYYQATAPASLMQNLEGGNVHSLLSTPNQLTQDETEA